MEKATAHPELHISIAKRDVNPDTKMSPNYGELGLNKQYGLFPDRSISTQDPFHRYTQAVTQLMG